MHGIRRSRFVNWILVSVGLLYQLFAPYTLSASLADIKFYSRPSAQFQSLFAYPLYLLNSPFGVIGWFVYSTVPELIVAGLLIKRNEKKTGKRLLLLYCVNIGLGSAFFLLLMLAFESCGAAC